MITPIVKFYKASSCRMRHLTTIFISSAVLMGMEVTAARLVAPYFGLTIVVWSSLISIILFSLSIGSIIGGRFSDEIRVGNKLPYILFSSAICIGLSTALSDPISTLISTYFSNNSLGAFITIIILWGPAATFLGMVTPIIFHQQGSDDNIAGQNYGFISAIATIGSIFGTLLCGLFLLPYFGSRTILYSCSVSMLLLSVWNFRCSLRSLATSATAITAAFIFEASLRPVKDQIIIDTVYSRAIIKDKLDSSSGWTVRELLTDPFLINTAMLIEPANNYASPFAAMHRELAQKEAFSTLGYPKFARLINIYKPQSKRILILGGGGYLVSKNILSEIPSAVVDVVEIDSGITKVAQKYFGLSSHQNLNLIEQDARAYINKTSIRYDAIFVDVYTSAAAPPFWTMTKEAISQMKAILNPGGIVVTNLIGIMKGKGGNLFRGLHSTHKAVFSELLVFAVKNCELSNEPQNFIILSSEQSLQISAEDSSGILSHLCPNLAIESAAIFYDNFAPVEIFAEEVLSALR